MGHKAAKRIRKILKIAGIEKQELREYDQLLPKVLKPSFTSVNKIGSFRSVYRAMKQSLKEK